MKQQTSPAIVLRRTNYGEADRIITFLTPVGKVRALVKGVRRSKSKLAGGIELFSESSITFIETRGDLARIISTRLNVHWDCIVKQLQRMMFGYEAMKHIDSMIEDDAERSYFDTLKSTLAALNDESIPLSLIELWFYTRLLNLLGREPNLRTDDTGKSLSEEMLYGFSNDSMCFVPSAQGVFRAEHIKILRLAVAQPPSVLKQVQGVEQLVTDPLTLIKQLVQTSAT